MPHPCTWDLQKCSSWIGEDRNAIALPTHPENNLMGKVWTWNVMKPGVLFLFRTTMLGRRPIYTEIHLYIVYVVRSNFFKRWIRNSCWTRICSSKIPVSPFKEAVGSTLLKVQVKPMFSHNCFHGLSQCQASTSSCVQEIFPGPQKAGWSQEDKHRVFWWNM